MTEWEGLSFECIVSSSLISWCFWLFFVWMVFIRPARTDCRLYSHWHYLLSIIDLIEIVLIILICQASLKWRIFNSLIFHTIIYRFDSIQINIHRWMIYFRTPTLSIAMTPISQRIRFLQRYTLAYFDLIFIELFKWGVRFRNMNFP